MNRPVSHWSWFGETSTDVELGELDGASELVFTSGQCHAFALELAHATGWELCGLGWVDSPETGEPVPGHVVCRDGDGDLYDIQGPGVEDRWDAWDVRPVDRDTVNSWVGNGYLEPDLDAASTFVQPWIDQYDLRPYITPTTGGVS